MAWSIAPSVGSISASGLYTAPASIASTQTVTVTATSHANASKTASASITLTPPATTVAVAVSPSSSSLASGATQQFSATVTGSSNTAVTWSIAPAVGSISTTGLYTAPASITATQTITVNATSAADSTKTATASIALTPPVSTGAVYRVYAGAASYTDPQGNVWSPDAAYASSSGTATSAVAIGGTTSPALYQSFRYCWTNFGYHFPVANGSYQVKLRFAETQYASQGQRVFSINLNGWGVVTNLDVLGVAGAANTALDRVFGVTVTNGAIDVGLVPVFGNPMLSAIEITSPAWAVAPARAALTAGQTLQLNAPAGSTWSLAPALGSISPAGLYTAPASIPSNQQVLISANSNGQVSTASVTLNPPAAAWTPIRIIAGGGDLVDPAGQVWAGDTGYTGGYFSLIPASVGNTTFAQLYRSQRWFYSSFQYQFTVPNGTHTVRLKFAETQFSGAGQRLFNVSINGQAALTNFDIAAQAGGPNLAVDVTIPAMVMTGQIIIQITPVRSNAVINGIEIL